MIGSAVKIFEICKIRSYLTNHWPIISAQWFSTPWKPRCQNKDQVDWKKVAKTTETVEIRGYLHMGGQKTWVEVDNCLQGYCAKIVGPKIFLKTFQRWPGWFIFRIFYKVLRTKIEELLSIFLKTSYILKNDFFLKNYWRFCSYVFMCKNQIITWRIYLHDENLEFFIKMIDL